MFKLLIHRIMTLLTYSVRTFVNVVTVFEKNLRLHKFASTRFSVQSRTNTSFIGSVVGRSDSSRRQTGKGPKPTALCRADRLPVHPGNHRLELIFNQTTLRSN